MAVKFNKKELKRIDKAIDKGLIAFGEEIGQIVKERQVVPKKTGALEASQKVESIGEKRIRLSYSEPYAHRLYYNEEGLTIHRAKRKGKVNDGEKVIRNRWAQDHWLEDILYNKNNKAIIAKYIKGFIGYSTSDFDYERKEKTKPVETPKPVENPAVSPDVNKVKDIRSMTASEYRALHMKQNRAKKDYTNVFQDGGPAGQGDQWW